MSPDRPQLPDVEQILAAILRGAAKILGCVSANLIVFNQESGEVHIRVGTTAERAIALGEVETVFGSPVQETVFSLDEVADSLVAHAWRERVCCETSSMQELVGTAFAPEVIERVAGLLPSMRFICVPVTFGSRIYGVMVLTKEDIEAFGPQRREILLRYAQRIGEIIDNDLRSRGRFVTRRPDSGDQLVKRDLLHLALAETAPALLLDPELRITSCNRATSRLFGYDEAALAGQPIGLLFRNPDDVRTIMDQQLLFLADGYFEDLAVLRHCDGRLFHGKVRSLLLADDADRVIGSVVVIQDQALAEGEEPALHAHRIMRRERLATMGELAAQLAHEIRNPLVSIGASLDVLSRRPGLEDEVRRTLTTVAAEVTRVDHLLHDYLTLSARRGGRVTTVSVAALIEDAWRLFAGGQADAAARWRAEVEQGLELLADYEGLRHVLLNLLRNAQEASPPDSPIRCRARGSRDDVCIEVLDEGPGLKCPAESCLEPFFTTKANGTGMGLTVCQKILQAHGGTLMLANRRTGGCRATVVLPRKVVA